MEKQSESLEEEEPTIVDTLVSYYGEMLHHINTLISDEMVDGVPIRKLFISNLAQRTTFKDLKICFSKYGNIENCYLRRNQGKSNYAFVTFSNVEDAERAKEFGSRKQIRLHNRVLRVMPADSWNQPDSVEQLYYKDKEWNKVSKEKTINDQYVEECLQNNVEETSIHILNNDCLKHIFSFLPIMDRIHIERVCKRWRILNQESWHTMKILDLSPSTWGLSSVDKINTVMLRKVLLKCGKFLKQINLSESLHCLNQSALIVIAKLCPNLTNIDISGLIASTSGINLLANNCNNITKFILGPSVYRLDSDLKKLFEVHKNLEYVEINKNSFSGICLLYLPTETLHTIILYKCAYLQDRHLLAALKKLENLKYLTIDECDSITECTLEVISKYCINLREFKLRHLWSLVKIIYMLYFTHLVNLQVLKLSRLINISDYHLVDIATYCQQLTCIDITGCHSVSDIGLGAIATLPKLEKLSINYLDLISDCGLRNLHDLKELECRSCRGITDEGISFIIMSSPVLQLLDLSACPCITDVTLKTAIEACNNRSSDVILKMIIGGTSIYASSSTETTEEKLSPFLQTINVNICKQDPLMLFRLM